MADSNVSQALAHIAPSATMAISARARELRAAGRNVLNMSMGEPDFDTPEPIKQAAIRAIVDGKTKYTNVDGIPELKEAVCAKFARENALSYTPQEINVSPGGKAVIYNALRASLNPGDEVLIPAPYWVSYPDMTRLCGGKPVILPTSAENGYRLRPEALEAAITPRTRWLILNSPSNPSGAAYSETDLRALADVLEPHTHVWILSDDIYEHLVFDDFSFATIAAVAPALHARTLTMNGVSKAYAMTGWRIGYAGGPEPLMRAMAKVMSQTTSNPCSISQWAALAALTGTQDALAERRAAFEKRRNTVLASLAEAPGLTCAAPEGAFYVYPSCTGLIGATSADGRLLANDLDVAAALLDEENVAVVPGIAFGASPAFRLSYATSMDVLEDACTRIMRFCNRVRRAS